MWAQLVAQRGVQQVRGGVIPPNCVPPDRVHLGRHRIPTFQLSCVETDTMRSGATRGDPFHRLDVCEPALVGTDQAGVGYLSARLEIERRPCQHRVPLAEGVQLIDGGFVAVEECDYRCVHLGGSIAIELVAQARDLAGSRVVSECETVRGAGTKASRSPRLCSLLLHRRVEAGQVHGERAFAGQVLDEVDRKPVGVVQPEDVGPGQLSSLWDLGQHRFQTRETVVEHRVKAIFFGSHNLYDRVLTGRQLRIGVSHVLN